MSLNNEKFGITRNNLFEITKIVSHKMDKIKELLLDKYDIHFSNKNLSEIIGKIYEKETAEFLSKVTEFQVINAQSDQDPDLRFKKNKRTVKNVEIKVTSTLSTWTGGEFSKRPYDYILISWGENYDEYFIAYTHLEKDDWDSNIDKGFYGPSFKVKQLKQKKNKVILLGRINKRGTRVIRENIYQTKLID
ncbi:MAG: hypothetical protein GF308_11025 [Candidatus Heimdallarchaeota archaeon]|nr:hypothetical protein [Candidatus Heimdallarchaeota archaeon]